MKLNKKTISLTAGKSYRLKASYAKGDSVKKCKSSNKKVATVSKKGVISARQAGKVRITIYTKSGKKATCKVTVPSITLKSTKATIKVGKSTTIKVKETYPKKEKVTYKSSNTKVATVNSKGKVVGKKAGKATITVTTKSGATAKFKVTVKK